MTTTTAQTYSPIPSTVHHLATELYSDTSKTFRIHLGIRRQNQVFVDHVAAKTSGIIRGYLAKHSVPTHVWALFPSRISLIIQPTAQKSIFTIASDLQKLVTKRALPDTASFYSDFLDHILRRSEDPKMLAAELLAQIPTLGLAASPKDYPHCGSHLHAIETLMSNNAATQVNETKSE